MERDEGVGDWHWDGELGEAGRVIYGVKGVGWEEGGTVVKEWE